MSKLRPNRFGVTADHPILGRPDKFGLMLEDAVDYAERLAAAGFENVKVRELLPDGTMPCVP